MGADNQHPHPNSHRDILPLPKGEGVDYRAFEIRGSHAHLGYALGKADPPFAMQSWWWPPPPAPFAASCRDVVHDFHPHLLDEFDAYADAQRLNACDLWQKCCRVNLKAKLSLPSPKRGGVGGEGNAEMGEGCSTFVRFLPSPQPSPDGRGRKVVVGRNYDYLPQQMRRQRIRFAPDCCANVTIGARGGVPCGRYDGLNQHGLFVSLHVVMTDTPTLDDVQPGVPFHLVARIALEQCHTAQEARDVLLHMPHLSSLNYLIADANDAFVVEADPRRVRVLPRDGDVLAATNHYRHPDMKPLQGARRFENSACRLSFLSGVDVQENVRRGESEKVGISPSHFLPFSLSSVDALLDHAGAIMADRTAPVCGMSGSLTTLWSCVAELTTKRIRYAAGAPGFAPYEELFAF
jgi:hypothetical protein